MQRKVDSHSCDSDYIAADPSRSGVGLSRIIDVVMCSPVPLVLAGVQSAFHTAEDLRIVGEADTLLDARELCVTHLPDVLLLDTTTMTCDTGLVEQLASLHQRPVPTPVLVMIDPHLRQEFGHALARHVAGVIRRDAQPIDIAAAIRQVAGGRAFFGGTQVPPSAVPGLSRAEGRRLTRRENQVLELVALGHTTRSIGCQLHITDATVKFHIRQLAFKLGVRTRAGLVYRAVQRELLSLTLRTRSEERVAQESASSTIVDRPSIASSCAVAATPL